MRVEQRALRFAAQQRLMRMLTVNVDQALAYLAQLLDGDWRAIQVCARSAFDVYQSTQQQAVLRIQVVRLQALGCDRRIVEIELGTYLGTLATCPYQAAVGAIAEGKGQGIDKNRLAGAGFTGQGAEAPLKFELQAIDQHEIANRQTAEHDRVVVEMIAQCSFGRSLQCSF